MATTTSKFDPSVSMANVSHKDKRIAVVGMAVKYAGSRNKEEFWETLMANKSAAQKISDTRLGSKYRSEHYVPERSKVADTFCNERYGCVEESVNNEHDLLLNLAESALQDAKEKRGDGKSLSGLNRCGIVSGCLSFPMDNLQGELLNLYQNHMEKNLSPEMFADVEKWSEREKALNPKASDRRNYLDPATYVADKLGLGPLHYSLDAACASALYVLRLAQDHLVSGAADIMLAGAVCFPEPFFILSGFSTFHAMPVNSDTGISYPLHHSSQGLTPGEGGSIMVLKRLEDAVRDGDHIYGTILGVNVSNAGCGLPLSPHQPSEESCLMDTYTRINRDPKTVQYVECHATGTPQGDRAEINAVRKCFEGSIPRIGSTKGNFGHTLVAAGFAGMCKVLLSMERGIIPPTPGIDDTTKMDPLVVTEPMPWPDTKGDLKRAGLSAFGFGATNAHAVFEEFDAKKYKSVALKIPRSMSSKFGSDMRMAIVGMDCTFGTLKGLDAFENAIYNGLDGARDLPQKRWRFLGRDQAFLDACGLKQVPRGCYIEDVEVNFKRLRTPLTPDDMLRPLQLLAVSTIDRAIVDSGLKKGGHVAVLVGLGTDLELYRHRARVALKERLRPEVKSNEKMLNGLMKYVNDCGTSTSYTSYIGNLVATRVSSQWGFTGPSFTITEGNNSVYRCAEIAKYMLETGEVEAVVVAGVDLCASAENFYVKTRRYHVSQQRSPTASFERNADGYFVGEGCGALVMKRANDCQPEERVYGCIDAIASGNNPAVVASATIQEAKLSGNVELLELTADSARFCKDDSVLAHQLTCEGEVEAYGKVLQSKWKQNVAVGSVKANVGDVGYASGAASLIKTALCLYNRYLPANANWTGPSDKVNWSDNFYACETSRAWYKNNGERRVAAISGVSEGGSCYGLILSDSEGHHEQGNRASLDEEAPRVITIKANTQDDILAKLEKELAQLQQATGTASHADQAQVEKQQGELATKVYYRLLGESLQQKGTFNLVLSLVATPKKLQREMELALKGIPRCVTAKRDWTSPSGSTFAPNPLKSDKVAFMYGEGRSPYFGVGQDLARVWPALHEMVNAKTTNLWSEGDRWLLPRTSTIEELKQAKSNFDMNQIEMFRIGVYISMCFTDYTRQVLGLKPKSSFGLSLGEVSMLFALSPTNCKLSEEMTNRLRTSEVWSSALAVEFQALRKLWNVPENAPVESFWQGYLVHATRDEIEKAIGQDNKYVRLLIVNDSSSALIGGKPEECEKVLAKLNSKLPSIPVTQGMIGHCPEVLPYVDAIGYIHEMLEIPENPGCDMFTSITNTKLVNAASTQAKDKGAYGPSIREFVAKLYSKIADFPQVVQTVHKADNDVFVEVGPNNTRSMAVKKILGPNIPHISVAIDRQNESSWNQIVRMVAVLLSHQVPGIQLDSIYHPQLIDRCLKALKPAKANPFLRSIELNGYFNPDLNAVIAKETMAKLPPADTEIARRISSKAIVKVSEMPFDPNDITRRVEQPKKRVQQSSPSLKTIEETPVPVKAQRQQQQQQESPINLSNIQQLRQELLQFDKELLLPDGVRRVYPVDNLGDKTFLKTYQTKYPLYLGAMGNGISGTELVMAAGDAGMLAVFGTAGLPLSQVETGLQKLKQWNGIYGVNLVQFPEKDGALIDLFLKYNCQVLEASGFLGESADLVRYRCAGLSAQADGTVCIKNKIIAKVSRTEIVETFMRPPSEAVLAELVKGGKITQQQADLARRVPLADDITIEADSAGHTDNRPIHVILPLVIQMRNKICKETSFKVRVGAAGGIGCPLSALAAFDMGAAFVVTGSINQLARQAGTSDHVRSLLAKSTYSDVSMATSGDFVGKVQVLKKGSMFHARANKFVELFHKYGSFEECPGAEVEKLEKRVFKQTVAQVWEQAKQMFNTDTTCPRKRMKLCIQWYLTKASEWAQSGEKSRAQDFQIYCGPSIGSFNDFISGSYLDPVANSNKYPDVAQINKEIITGTYFHARLNQLRGAVNVDELTYRPSN